MLILSNMRINNSAQIPESDDNPYAIEIKQRNKTIATSSKIDIAINKNQYTCNNNYRRRNYNI